MFFAGRIETIKLNSNLKLVVSTPALARRCKCTCSALLAYRRKMKLDAALPPVGFKDVSAIAKAAEEIGFDALWTQETQHDPFLPCALIAEHTTRLNFGTAIAVSFARSPANLAYTAWDLAAQSNGRFILGLGTQVKAHIERRFGQPWPESVTGKLREQIQVIRAFWDCWQNGTKLNFRGEYYKITLMSPFFNPGLLTSLPAPSRSTPVG